MSGLLIDLTLMVSKPSWTRAFGLRKFVNKLQFIKTEINNKGLTKRRMRRKKNWWNNNSLLRFGENPTA